MKVIFLNTRNLRNENLILFFSKSKYPNPIRNNRTRTKNIRTRPEVQKYPNEFYTSIPKYSKIRNTRSERIPERPPLGLPQENTLFMLSNLKKMLLVNLFLKITLVLYVKRHFQFQLNIIL